MDPRVGLLKEFSRGFARGKAKIECEEFGFAFLERLLSDSRLEYGFLADTRLLHKYKIVDIEEHRMDELLQLHVMKECNVCLYFDAEKNDVLCFNIDNNHRTNETAIAQLSLVLDTLRECLLGLGCEPLIVASGRGYHVWLRLEQAIENKALYNFMVQTAARALLPLLMDGKDHRTVRFRFYPDIEDNDARSLRLFGSEHANYKVFSRVSASNAVLDEADSWKYIEDFMRNKTTPAAIFWSALGRLQWSESK